MAKIVLVLLSAAVLYIVVTIAEGYLRAPGIVARHLVQQPLTLELKSLTPEQLQILLAVEDPRFFHHPGVDLRTPGAGMTSITQGLVKFLYFTKFRPGLPKIRQTFLALGFDARVSKRTQLAIFINSVNMGRHERRSVLGFQNAAREYFGRPVNELTRREYTSLVAMCIGPNEFHVISRSERNAERVERIERYLAGQCSPKGLRDVYYDDCAGKR